MRTTLALAPRPTASPDTFAWEPCPSCCLVCCVILLPRDALNCAGHATTGSIVLVAGVKTPTQSIANWRVANQGVKANRRDFFLIFLGGCLHSLEYCCLLGASSVHHFLQHLPNGLLSLPGPIKPWNVVLPFG